MSALLSAVPAALLLALAACASAPAPPPDFLLLGEVHDNAQQHALRAQRLAALLADGRPTAIVFEQLPAARNAALDALQRSPASVDELVDAGQLDRKAWAWPLHRPLFEAAVAGHARVLGGNLARDDLRRLMREGDAAWPPELLALVQRTPWSEAQRQAQLQAIDDGHCGLLPAAMQPPMARAQRARDAALAQALLDARAAGAQRVVLIAGNGHVDRELGVPRYLEAAGVAPARIHVVGYLEAGPADRGRYDERVETAAAARDDPCLPLKK